MDLEQCLDDLVARIQAENDPELTEAEQLRKQEELNEAMRSFLETITER